MWRRLSTSLRTLGISRFSRINGYPYRPTDTAFYRRFTSDQDNTGDPPRPSSNSHNTDDPPPPASDPHNVDDLPPATDPHNVEDLPPPASDPEHGDGPPAPASNPEDGDGPPPRNRWWRAWIYVKKWFLAWMEAWTIREICTVIMYFLMEVARRVLPPMARDAHQAGKTIREDVYTVIIWAIILFVLYKLITPAVLRIRDNFRLTFHV